MAKIVPRYSILFPAAAILFVLVLQAVPALASEGDTRQAAFLVLAAVLLCGASFAAVSHADVIAARLGQPFGTLVLTLSVTIIEVSLIAALMLHGKNNPTLVRESVFSVIMIACTGIVGLCLLLGGLKHREQEISQQGVSGYLSVIFALAILLLVLPNDTHDGTHGEFSSFQLIFMALVASGLYFVFLYMQTVRHRDHFQTGLAPERPPQPSTGRFLLAIVLLLASLGAIVALSEPVAAGFESFIDHLDLADPDAVTGALVAALLLMPEGLTAVRAAARNQLQQSLNVALGSALATIALTIPTMAIISVIIDRPMVLGLDPEDRTLVLLTLALSILSFGTGKTNALSGFVHLIVFCVYVMLLFVP